MRNFSLLGRGLPAVVVDQQRLKGLDEVLQATCEVGVLNLVCKLVGRLVTAVELPLRVIFNQPTQPLCESPVLG